MSERSLESISALGVIAPPPIHVSTPTFDGPLGTLFAFVRDHRVDLLEIPLFPICEAYFGYLIASADANLDEAAAALSALAYLLERKAFLLLPVPEVEPDPWEEPAELLHGDTTQYHAAIDVLSQWHQDRSALFFRPGEAALTYELPYQLANVSPHDLSRAFERIIQRATPAAMPDLSVRRLSLADQMAAVLGSLRDDFQTIEELIPEPIPLLEAVYWFLAILELIRLHRAVVRIQDESIAFARASASRPRVILPEA